MLKQRAAMQQHAAALEAAGPAAEGADRPRFTRYLALVLCPNVALCQQVAAAVNALRGPAGPDGSGQQQQQQQLVSAAVINSSNPPPFETPDVVVATPAGLLNIIDEAGGAYGWLWSEEGMQARIRHVILDEADLLLTPAYSKATQRILTLFKTADRRRVEAKLFEELGLSSKDEFDRLPRALQVAAWTGGAPAMLAEGYRPRRTLDPNAKYGPYWRRQYIYSAATLPAATYSDVGSAIAKAHPDAVWVSTDLLHASKPQVEHAWREVDDSTFTAALLDAVKSDPDYQAGSGKTLVFAADGASADAVSQVLAGGDVPHVVYHKSRPMGEQAAALAALREQPGCVMVCTDAAARGLDVEAIKHVVQADFAANAIDFIHRIGRTARAGRGGRVTSLFRDHNRALVEVLQTYIADGVALEAAFSRARSFSKKLKKTGGVFVPRGMAAGGEEAAGAGEEEKEGAAEGQEASRAAGAQGRGGPGRGVGGGGRAAGRGRGRAGREQEREVRL
ncbi:hypothetical protein HYH02_009431 [Chlamydomonas schloesseri]|uniref:ATP-dependent RNA helicase n=1 Tax=Chlamydomonas schloesseri TaxID=2026947 RepID=A0A835TRJ9_9CHLO|nr:hypothetical protein HYH02_009431 [Chlamydomonas schloesseri]|eukprot:KAG2443015.1 hypothetical protein HYH02_009431 [Chlamydomonas schloesseri]